MFATFTETDYRHFTPTQHPVVIHHDSPDSSSTAPAAFVSSMELPVLSKDSDENIL